MKTLLRARLERTEGMLKDALALPEFLVATQKM